MKSLILDTNAFLRILLDDIPEQADLVENIIKKAKNRQITILVPQIVIFEINFILQKYYLFEKNEIIEKLKPLISAPYFIIESQNVFGKALSIYEKENISFVDAFLLGKAVVEEAELFTFDKKLGKVK